MTDDLLGERVQICHKTGMITGINRFSNSVTVSIEIGGVHQDISVAMDVVEDHLEDGK